MFERRGRVIDDIHTDRDTYTAKGLKLVALEHENKKRVSLEQKKNNHIQIWITVAGTLEHSKQTAGVCLFFLLQRRGTHPQTFWHRPAFVYSGKSLPFWNDQWRRTDITTVA